MAGVDRVVAQASSRAAALVAWLLPLSTAIAAGPPASRPANVAVLSHLNLPTPAFRAAVDRGEFQEACRLLADHFASRPRLSFAPELFSQTFDNAQAGASYLRDKAEFALHNRFAFLFEYVETGPDFDWNGRFGRGDPEITWWINRFYYLSCLEQEYDRTGRKEYPRHGVELILDWIRKNPIERAGVSWASWRTLDLGLRLAEWSRFIDHFAAERIIRPDELTIMLASLREQTEYLIAHSGPQRFNWGFMEQCGIGIVALVFPEFREADRWLAGVLDVYKGDTAFQIYPDGSQEELTTHYGLTVVHSLARVIDLARQRNRPVPAALTDGLRRAATYSALTLKPDRSLVMLSDGDAVDVTPFLGYVARTFDLPEARYVLTCGREGAAPPLCRMFPHSGLAIFRDSWKPDARFLIFDAGPFGTHHQHEDALQFEVAAFGRSFVVDPGRYTYVPGPWRDYFVGTRSHATIMVDGGQQVRGKHPQLWRGERPIKGQFIANDDLALAVGDYASGYDAPAARGVTHRREILFVNHEYWVISDVLLGEGRHRIEQTFQYTPGPLKVSEDMAVTGHADANLAMLWLWPTTPEATVRTGQENPPVGWYSPIYGRKEAAPHLTLSAELELPARITLVLYPFRGALAPALRAETAIAQGADSLQAGVVSIKVDHQSATILIADPRDPPSPRAVGGVRLDADRVAAAVVSRGRAAVLPARSGPPAGTTPALRPASGNP